MPDILLFVIGFAVGSALAWLLVMFHSHARVQQEIADHKAKAHAAEQLAAELRRQMERRDKEATDLQAALEQERQTGTEARTRLEVAQQAMEAQRKVLEEASERLAATFKALSADALRANSQSFLDLAKQSLEIALNDARGDMDRRQEAVKGLVTPLQEALKRYEDQVRQLESRRNEDYGGLTAQLKELTSTHQQLRKETANLVTALRNPHVRGRWGELTLRRVVELAGLVAHCDFTEQMTTENANSRARPDLIVHLPAGRQIVVDAKVSLEAYLDALSVPSQDEHRAVLDAADVDPALIEDGMSRRVVIATPTTLVALMRAVAFGWRQEQIAENARRISDLGRDLYERLRTLSGHFEDVGTSLGRAVSAYNKAVVSLETRVLASARRFKELGAVASEEIPLVEPVDQAPRALAAASSHGGSEGEAQSGY